MPIRFLRQSSRVIVALITLAVGAAPGFAQKTKTPKDPPPSVTSGSTPPGAAADTPSTTTKQPKPKSIQSKIAADASLVATVGDYVPCEFTKAELLALRPEPVVYTLSSADAEALRSKTISEALDESNAGTFKSDQQRDKFVKDVSELDLQGRTSSQATGKLLSILNSDTESTGKPGDVGEAAKSSNPDFSKFLFDQYAIPEDDSTKLLGDSPKSAEEKLDIASELAISAIKKNAAAGPVTDTAAAKPDVDKTAKPPSDKPTPDSKKKPEDLIANVAVAKASYAADVSKNKLALSIQNTTAAFTRPDDVACSMTILSYRTTRYAFGQKIADEFIPIQIVVRNMNKDQEFLVHDAEAAVDMDINGRLGRYSSGVDKLTARTFMIASRDYDHRNLTVHIAQGIGIVLSSSSLVGGIAAKEAANVYNSGFLTALTGVWTDHSTDQLNLLNDEGFSSYRTERTVVPKSGTAEFVIFIRSDLFEEGWWAQSCAQNIAIKRDKTAPTTATVSAIASATTTAAAAATEPAAEPATASATPPATASAGTPATTTAAKPDDSKKIAKCIGNANADTLDPACSGSPEIGVDLESARRVCVDYYLNLNSQSPPPDPKKPLLTKVGKDEALDFDLAYFTPKTVHYKNWSSVSQSLFRELALTVVAGTHIAEESDNTQSLAKLDCPTDAGGDIDFDKAENNNIVCTLTGSGLDGVDALKLKNSANLADPATASATVTTTSTGTSKTTKATFALDTLGKLSAKSYKVSLLTSKGAETLTDQVVHLSGEPYLPPSGKPTPASVDFKTLLTTGSKPVTVKLTGYHLDELKEVQFQKAQGDNATGTVSSFSIPVEAGATATQAQVNLTSDNVKAGKITGDFSSQSLKLAICLISKSSPGAKESKQILEVTGNIAAAKSPAKSPTKTSVNVSPNPLSFGSEQLDKTTAARPVTLTNSGTSAVTKLEVKRSGANQDDFVADSSACGDSIAAGANCKVSVKFKPGAVGKRSATLEITYTGSDSTQQSVPLPMSGTGIKAAATSPK